VEAILVGELPQLGKEAKFMTIKQIIQSKIDILPENKQAEVLNFMNFLIESQSEFNSQQNISLQSPPKSHTGKYTVESKDSKIT
jgi:hypothetical protein